MTIDELSSIPDEHEIWEIIGYYLAQLCSNIILMIAPDVVVIGGGVVQHRDIILYHCRKHLATTINGYVEGDWEQVIRKATLTDPGLIGAQFLGQ